MKRYLLALTCSMVGFCYLTLDNSLQLLGITRDGAIEYINSSILNDALAGPASLSKVAVTARTTIATDLLQLAREYSTSPAFKQAYAEYRKSRKPAPPDPPTSTAEVMKQQLQAQQEQIKEAEQNVAKAPADQRKQLQEYVDALKAAAAQQPGLSPEQASAMDEALRQEYKEKLDTYNEALSKWEETYPDDGGRTLIRSRLQDYLDLVSSVNFDAELKTAENGVKTFVDAEYETKPGEWKRCFRAGKDANMAAKTVVERWLKETK